MDSYPDITCEPTSLLLELASLPPKPPRSKLEPHRELIRELRRKGGTYPRGLPDSLPSELGLQVAPSTFAFLSSRCAPVIASKLSSSCHRQMSRTRSVPNSDQSAWRPSRRSPQSRKRSGLASSSAKTEPLTLSTQGGAH